MTQTAKIAIAAVIVAALAAVVGYDLMYGKPKSTDATTETAPPTDGGFTIVRETPSNVSPTDRILEAERREAGAGVAPPPADPPAAPASPLPLTPDSAPSNEEY